MQEKERGLPVVMYGRPGHLMLTSAFHDLADIARLELQPLRSTLPSSAQEGAPHGDSGHSRGDLGSADSAWEGGGPQQQSGVGSSAAGKGRMNGEAAGKEQPSDQDGTVQGEGGSAHRGPGRKDSAADFSSSGPCSRACNGSSSAPSSIAMSASYSEDVNVVSIQEQEPDQAAQSHSLAVWLPDERGADSHRPADAHICLASAPNRTGILPGPDENGSAAHYSSVALDDPESDLAARSKTVQAKAVRSAAWRHTQQQGPSSPQSLPGSRQGWGMGNSCSGLVRWCRSVPWSQIINLPIIAALAGLLVGCVPLLKAVLFGPEAPLGFIRDCLEVRAQHVHHSGACTCVLLACVASKCTYKTDCALTRAVLTSGQNKHLPCPCICAMSAVKRLLVCRGRCWGRP